MNLGELIEKLCIANIKLYNICDLQVAMSKNPADYTKEEIVQAMEKDIILCRERAQLKNTINTTMGFKGEEVKMYNPNNM